jgi:CheY-like chemotaxis protein
VTEASTASGTGPTVLLVDDTPTVLHVYAAMLRKANYRVLACASALAAREVLLRETPDVIVLDYMMPVTDGPAFLRQIRADPRLKNIAVILLTASDQEEHIEESFAAGGNDYLIKPVDRRILLARVGAMVEAKNHRTGADRADGLALERDHLLRELKEAEDLQRSQLPRLPLSWDGWTVTGALLPCSHVGGDLYDVVMGPDERQRMIVLIDVSGHGLAAAMVGSSVRTYLRLLGGRGPREVAVDLNRHLCERGELYACIAIVCVDRDGVQIVNAGLPPIAVIEDGAVTQLISAHGTPPGLLPGDDYAFTRVPRRPGIRFALMSDGMTEPFSRTADTPSVLAKMGVLQGAFPTQEELTDRMRTLLAEAAIPHPDDATLMMLGDQRGGSRP